MADSGYGSQENYEYCEKKEIEAYIKYNYFHKEQKRKYKNNPFLPAYLYYNAKENYLVCPNGQRMYCVGTQTRKSDLGYLSQVIFIKPVIAGDVRSEAVAVNQKESEE